MNDAADNLDRADQFSWLTVAAGLFNRARGWAVTHKRPLKLFALIVALTLFCGGLFLSLRAHPDILDSIKLAPLLVLLLIVSPIGVAISAVDFQLLGRLSGVAVGFWRAAEVTIYTRAANMLPIPGSMAVRMAILKGRGATFTRSGAMMFLFTAIWGGVGFCFSAFWLSFQAPPMLAAFFGVTGAVILAGCWIAVRRFRLDPMLVLQAAGIRFAVIALDAFALMVAIWAIGADAAFYQTATLVVSSFIASIVPAGLGVRETVIAIMAPVAGIDAATGFLAGAVVRFTVVAFLAGSSLVMLAAHRSHRLRDTEHERGTAHAE